MFFLVSWYFFVCSNLIYILFQMVALLLVLMFYKLLMLQSPWYVSCLRCTCWTSNYCKCSVPEIPFPVLVVFFPVLLECLNSCFLIIISYIFVKVDGGSGAANDMANTIMQKFWDSALALDPADEEFDTNRSFSLQFSSFSWFSNLLFKYLKPIFSFQWNVCSFAIGICWNWEVYLSPAWSWKLFFFQTWRSKGSCA